MDGDLVSVSTVLTAPQETSAAENKKSKNRNPPALFTFSITNTNNVCLLEALMQQVGTKSDPKKNGSAVDHLRAGGIRLRLPFRCKLCKGLLC